MVLYSRTTMPWATRFWWMLRWLGFDDAAIQDGGYTKWVADERPVSNKPNAYPPQNFKVNERPRLFVGRDDVLSAIDDPATCTICAQGPDVYSGENPRYGRPGRVPVASMCRRQVSSTPRPWNWRRLIERPQLSPRSARIRTNVSSPIAAGVSSRPSTPTSSTSWGTTTSRSYDNSMSEWATDASLPTETD